MDSTELEPTPELLETLDSLAKLDAERQIAEINEMRRLTYQMESDPIFFQAQREETYTLDDWKAKVAEINDRYPYPVAPKASK